MPRESRGYGGRPRRFIYDPTGWDMFQEKRGSLKPGDEVVLSNQSGVGQLKGPFRYVEGAESGEFHGMVNRSSLKPAGRKKKPPPEESE